MRNKTVSNSKGLAGWLDDFIVGLSKKEASTVEIDENNEEVIAEDVANEEIETLATININDLEKVVWNDETFRVHFDENGANVINDFGNSVTFLKGLRTIEEVDHALNSKQVVTSSEEVNEEDVITADEIAPESDFEDALTAAIDSIPTEEDQEVVASEEELIEDALVDENVVATKADKEEDVVEAIIAGFEEMEKRMAAIEQMYAYNPQIPQDEMATQVLEDETKRFTETADETQKKITDEQSHDLTTPAGRVEISVQHTHEQPSDIEQMVTEEVPAVEEQKDVVEQVEETEEVADPNIEKLTGKDEKIFQNGICPETGEELVKAKTAGSFLGIYSPKGGTEYAVNLNTGEIFKYKG